MSINEYIDKVNTRFRAGISTEHSYRGDLQNLLESIATDVLVTNEPTRVACGAPDYIITRRNIPVGYIEAKDIGKPLNSKDYNEQFDRYKKSLGNLIITDYLEFQLYHDGDYVLSISVGEIQGNKIIPKPENFDAFTNLVKDFCTHTGQTIKSSKKLAEMMAGKARLLANVIEKALIPTEAENQVYETSNNTLHEQYLSFQQILIHDITEKTFADIYAQTIAYGMFAARLHDPCLENFSRQEAAELIPKSNPFLRKLFQYIAGYDLDDRIKWIVDALADIFRATNVAELLKDFGKATQQSDPIIHFYETFLTAYDPALRKSRGVWYTPEPVVNFIVRAVDELLKTEFGLPQGIADTSKTKILVDVQGKKIEQEVHKVQILDPAAGTGTFLAEVVKQIYKRFEGQQGIWSNYVEDHLIPRLNGFEILMASYAMAHLKLDMLLTETGYLPSFGGAGGGRLKVYLTNSLEEHHPNTGTLFANWLSTEANEANYIKRDTPVMVVLGNPPYSVSSSNKSEWIEKLTADYKKDLNERNIQPLSDDYIKFIRFGQHFVEKNGSGILAYISNNSFIDGIIHRQMRKHLLESFDKIYILDLHGNAKKKEVCPNGSADENVFDIMQGVSINIFVKTDKKKKNEFGQVLHYNLQGNREFKYKFLFENILKSVEWNKAKALEPFFIFRLQDTDLLNLYNKGLNIETLFLLNATGVKTERDNFAIKFNGKEINEVISDLKILSADEIRMKYKLEKDGRDWQLSFAKKDICNNEHQITKIQYRPFDYRFTAYTGITKGFMAYPREKIMSHLVKDNIAFVSTRLNRGLSQGYNFISKNILDLHLLDSAADSLQAFPLYLYPETNRQHIISQTTSRIPNLNPEIVNQIAEQLSLKFTNEPAPSPLEKAGDEVEKAGDEVEKAGDEVEKAGNEVVSFSPIDILDYIYAILHSPTYREKYKEFLKIDFPRVPYPKDTGTFWQLVKLGGELRQVHLLESPVVERFITTYPNAGSNLVEKVRVEISQDAAHSAFDPIPANDSIQAFDPTPALPKGEGESYGYVTANDPSEVFDPTPTLPKGEGERYGYVTANPLTYRLIKEIRDQIKNNPTEAEQVLWEYLRDKKTGHKIRRQHIIDDFIPDFVCLSKKVVIEVDGKIHAFKKEYDTLRTFRLNELGYDVIRFTNDEVLRLPAKAAQDIQDYLDDKKDSISPPSPLNTSSSDFRLVDKPGSHTPPPEAPGEVSGYINSVHPEEPGEVKTPSSGNSLLDEPVSHTPPLEGPGEVKVWINNSQYFSNVPQKAWNFYIGGYQPAQKWLKDRKGRVLAFEDILHYQKIIVALNETDRLMKEIDKIEIE
jgi:very-short-patch-repair endonuclease